MRVGVLTQAAQSACLVRLQLLARPVISQVKLPHLRYQAQYDLNIHGMLHLPTPSSAAYLTASSVSRRGSQHVQLLSQGDWDLSVLDHTRYMPSRLQD